MYTSTDKTEDRARKSETSGDNRNLGNRRSWVKKSIPLDGDDILWGSKKYKWTKEKQAKSLAKSTTDTTLEADNQEWDTTKFEDNHRKKEKY